MTLYYLPFQDSFISGTIIIVVCIVVNWEGTLRGAQTYAHKTNAHKTNAHTNGKRDICSQLFLFL